MGESCDLCNLTTGPVVKLHANNFKLIQKGNLFTGQCKWIVSFTLYIFIFQTNDNDNGHLVESDIVTVKKTFAGTDQTA